MPEPRTCSLGHLDISNAAQPPNGNAAQLPCRAAAVHANHHLSARSPASSPAQAVCTRYAVFNEYLYDRLIEQGGVSLSRETLRRILWAADILSFRKRRPPLISRPGSNRHRLEGHRPDQCRTVAINAATLMVVNYSLVRHKLRMF